MGRYWVPWIWFLWNSNSLLFDWRRWEAKLSDTYKTQPAICYPKPLPLRWNGAWEGKFFFSVFGNWVFEPWHPTIPKDPSLSRSWSVCELFCRLFQPFLTVTFLWVWGLWLNLKTLPIMLAEVWDGTLSFSQGSQMNRIWLYMRRRGKAKPFDRWLLCLYKAVALRW